MIRFLFKVTLWLIVITFILTCAMIVVPLILITVTISFFKKRRYQREYPW